MATDPSWLAELTSLGKALIPLGLVWLGAKANQQGAERNSRTEAYRERVEEAYQLGLHVMRETLDLDDKIIDKFHQGIQPETERNTLRSNVKDEKFERLVLLTDIYFPEAKNHLDIARKHQDLLLAKAVYAYNSGCNKKQQALLRSELIHLRRQAYHCYGNALDHLRDVATSVTPRPRTGWRLRLPWNQRNKKLNDAK